MNEELLDRERIRDVMLRYCRGVDRLDADLITSAYHPDAVDEHGSTGTFTGDNVGAGIVALMRSARFSMHHVTNQLIELHDRDHAGCETYFTVWQTVPHDDGEMLLHALGRYVDRMERRDGEWRIAHRVVVVEDARLMPGGTPASGPGPARRDRTDPSYDVLAGKAL